MFDEVFFDKTKKFKVLSRYLKEEHNTSLSKFIKDPEESKQNIIDILESLKKNPNGIYDSKKFDKYTKILEALNIVLESKFVKIDPATGALLNTDSHPDQYAGSRPDLYWREPTADTCGVVRPHPVSFDEWENYETSPSYHSDKVVIDDTDCGCSDETKGKTLNDIIRDIEVITIDTPTPNIEQLRANLSRQAFQAKQEENDSIIEYVNNRISELNAKVDTVEGLSDKIDILSRIVDDLLRLQTVKESEEPNMKKRKLNESDLAKAETVLAIRNIVDELQSMTEKLSEMKIEKIAPIIERLKVEFGLEKTEAFRNSVEAALDEAIDKVANTKDAVDTESLRISGDLPSKAEKDMKSEIDDEIPDFEDEDDIDVDTEIEDEIDSDMEDDELGFEVQDREMKEGYVRRRRHRKKKVKENYGITLVVETYSGKRGNKSFKSIHEMSNWVNLNEDRIKKIKIVR